MRNLLDKLDQSSIFFRLTFSLLAMIILGIGLFFSSRPSADTLSRPVPLSSSILSSTSSDAEEQKLLNQVEKVVKDLEDNPQLDKVSSAKEAIEKIKNEEIKQELAGRVQKVEAQLKEAASAVPEATSSVVAPSNSTIGNTQLENVLPSSQNTAVVPSVPVESSLENEVYTGPVLTDETTYFVEEGNNSLVE